MENVQLADLRDGDEADFFAALTEKVELQTKNGKPYHRVTFRDAAREVSFPIWNDAPLADVCRNEWTPGTFFKMRATYRETQFGPQLDIHKIRPVNEKDHESGFSPDMLKPRSRFEPEAMYDELLEVMRRNIPADRPLLRQLVEELLDENRALWLSMSAARRNHHVTAGGLLEHTLSVTRTVEYLASRYTEEYPDLALDVPLAIAGAILHDIGKLIELPQQQIGPDYTVPGELIGHLLLGRDMVRDKGIAIGLDEPTRLHLEHLIIAHQRLPEWGSPKPPMTPESLLVHYADDTDAKFNIMYNILKNEPSAGPFTSRKNALGQKVYRGGPAEE